MNNNQTTATKQRRRTSRSNSSAARLNHATVNSDLSVIKGAKSSKPPSIITRKPEDITTASRSPLFSQLHWMMNDMSPRNLSPRTSSPSVSPRSYTPTKRSYIDTFAFDNHKSRTEDIAPVGTSSFAPSIINGDESNVTFSRSVRQRRDDETVFSSSLPAHSNLVPNTNVNTFAPPFDKILSPPSPSSYGQFPLFGTEHADLDTNGGSVQFDTSDTHNPQFFTSPQKPSVQNNSQFTFSLPEFKLNTDSSMVLSEPSMFDFDTL